MTAAATFEANGARFVAADDMIRIGWLDKGRAFEPETTTWAFDVMAGRSGAFVDVGASTGWFSIPMALRGHGVVAFEPNPAVCRRLTENAELNGVIPGGLEIHNAALSDRTGTVTMWINPAVPLTSGGSIQRATCAKPRRIGVDALRLDDLAGGLLEDAAPALIKIDVEWHELPVLAGAARVITTHRPHLILEANNDTHRDALARWLGANGYEWRRADDRNMLCSPRS